MSNDTIFWLAAIVVVCIVILAVILLAAKLNAEPNPSAGLGDEPPWLRNGEEERGPWGDQ